MVKERLFDQLLLHVAELKINSVFLFPPQFDLVISFLFAQRRYLPVYSFTVEEISSTMVKTKHSCVVAEKSLMCLSLFSEK